MPYTGWAWAWAWAWAWVCGPLAPALLNSSSLPKLSTLVHQGDLWNQEGNIWERNQSLRLESKQKSRAYGRRCLTHASGNEERLSYPESQSFSKKQWSWRARTVKVSWVPTSFDNEQIQALQKLANAELLLDPFHKGANWGKGYLAGKGNGSKSCFLDKGRSL